MATKVQGKVIRLTRGDTLNLTVRITKNGEPYTPEEDDRIRFALKKTVLDEEPIIIRDIPIDTLLLKLIPEDTKPLDFGKYKYDIELTRANGDVDTFIGPASFYITEEVH